MSCLSNKRCVVVLTVEPVGKMGNLIPHIYIYILGNASFSLKRVKWWVDLYWAGFGDSEVERGHAEVSGTSPVVSRCREWRLRAGLSHSEGGRGWEVIAAAIARLAWFWWHVVTIADGWLESSELRKIRAAVTRVKTLLVLRVSHVTSLPGSLSLRCEALCGFWTHERSLPDNERALDEVSGIRWRTWWNLPELSLF